ncbi:MAG: hypothetical protein AAGH15_08645 [Myxococcota bacterium]
MSDLPVEAEGDDVVGREESGETELREVQDPELHEVEAPEANAAEDTGEAPEADDTELDAAFSAGEADAEEADDERSGMHLAPVLQELILAPESESCFWEGLEGELGIFLATFAEGFEEGQELRLELRVSDGTRLEGPFDVRCRAVFLRAASERGWPGVGLELLDATDELRGVAERLAAVRDPMFWA